jgi:predicted amidohydrolase
MADPLRVACVQLTAGREVDPNLDAAEALIRGAAALGAQLVATPENVTLMEPERAAKFARAEDESRPHALLRFAAMAEELRIWLLAGSLPVKLPDDPVRLANRSYLFDPNGRILARYDKIHMFDVDLDSGESYRESAQFAPGSRMVLAEAPFGRIGLTVCYDLRFPALFRALAQAGARLITVPSAFTVPTGRAHWSILLRARAIETGCFVLAPAQTGRHEGGRETYGHSMIVAPWGEILAEAEDAPGIIIADLDLEQVDAARRRVPSLRHDRDWHAQAGA